MIHSYHAIYFFWSIILPKVTIYTQYCMWVTTLECDCLQFLKEVQAWMYDWYSVRNCSPLVRCETIWMSRLLPFHPLWQTLFWIYSNLRLTFKLSTATLHNKYIVESDSINNEIDLILQFITKCETIALSAHFKDKQFFFENRHHLTLLRM